MRRRFSGYVDVENCNYVYVESPRLEITLALSVDVTDIGDDFCFGIEA